MNKIWSLSSFLDGLHRIQISYSDSPDDQKKSEEEFIDFSDDQDNLVGMTLSLKQLSVTTSSDSKLE